MSGRGREGRSGNEEIRPGWSQDAEGGRVRGASAMGSCSETWKPSSDDLQSCRLASIWRPRGSLSCLLLVSRFQGMPAVLLLYVLMVFGSSVANVALKYVGLCSSGRRAGHELWTFVYAMALEVDLFGDRLRKVGHGLFVF